jgi:hypothetical protein
MGEKRIKWENFCNDAGTLGVKDIWDLGFEDNDYNAWFPEEKIPMLKQFCLDNPKYHIMSRDVIEGAYDADLEDGCEGTIYNRYVPGLKYYFLADGDSTPELSIEVNTHMSEEELLEFGQSEFFTKFREMQRDRGIPTLDELFPKRKIN